MTICIPAKCQGVDAMFAISRDLENPDMDPAYFYPYLWVVLIFGTLIISMILIYLDGRKG